MKWNNLLWLIFHNTISMVPIVHGTTPDPSHNSGFFSDSFCSCCNSSCSSAGMEGGGGWVECLKSGPWRDLLQQFAPNLHKNLVKPGI